MLLPALLAVCAPRLEADFDDLGAGARAIGMGNAYTAVADDAFGVYYNPAGLGFIRTGQIGADFGKLYVGLDDESNLVSGFGAIAFPLLKARLYDVTVATATARAAAAGVEVSSGAAAGLTVSTGTDSGVEKSTMTVKATYYDHLGTFAFGVRYFSLVDYYQESAYFVSYGRPVANKWAWGVSVKYLMEKYAIDDYLKASPVFQYGEKDSVAAVSADLGVIYNVAPRFFLGASLSDVNQPSMGLQEEDKIPYGLRLGMAWKERNLCWSLDGQYRRNQWYYMTGFERYLTSLFGLRAGIGMGGHNYFNVGAGFTVNLYRAQLDYVFQYPLAGIKDISGTHRMSFIFRFGRRSKEETEIGSIDYYYAKLQDEVENVRQRLQQMQNEKENLESILIEESTLRIRERIKAAKAEAARMSKSEPAPVVERRSSSSETREPKEVRHLVRAGETLQSIAEKYYGATKYWDEIYQANKDSVGRGGVVKPNQVLIIPPLSKQEGGVETPAQPKAAAKESAAAETPKAGGAKSAGAGAVKLVGGVTERVVPIQVPTSPGVKPVGVTGVRTEKINPVAGELEMAVKKRESPRAAAAGGQRAGISRRHLVQQGENLRSIAQKYYNDSNRWKEIYQANRDKVISGQVTPGQEIVIP
jgi:nucleoid-associated protein YgaU